VGQTLRNQGGHDAPNGLRQAGPSGDEEIVKVEASPPSIVGLFHRHLLTKR